MSHFASHQHHQPQSSRGHERPTVHLQFFSFGEDVQPTGRPQTDLPVLFEFNVRHLRNVPHDLNRYYTAKDPEVLDYFWSFPQHEAEYQRALATIHASVMGLRPGDPKEWAIMIFCSKGVHRSVAFMSRLHSEVRRWPMVTTGAIHLDLRKGMESRLRWREEEHYSGRMMNTKGL